MYIYIAAVAKVELFWTRVKDGSMYISEFINPGFSLEIQCKLLLEVKSYTYMGIIPTWKTR